MKDDLVHKTDLNIVYWSEEEINVSLTSSNGSLDVYYIPKKDSETPRGRELKEKFFKDGHFYFSEVQVGFIFTVLCVFYLKSVCV